MRIHFLGSIGIPPMQNSSHAEFLLCRIPPKGFLPWDSVGGIPMEKNPMWEKYYVGEILFGRNSILGIPCGRNPVWKESCVEGILWEESRLGVILLGGIPWEEFRWEEFHDYPFF